MRVEGREDLDILDETGATIEVIQVKAYTHPLILAPLSDYLDRSATLLAAEPTLRARLVTFGPIGPELDAAWRADGTERAKVRDKLSERGVVPSSAELLFTRLELDTVDEAELEAEVRAALGQLATAADVDASFDLLMLWLYASAERSLLLDREELKARLDSVGRYVAERSVYTREWFTNIVPIVMVANTEVNAELEQEYRAGVGARAEHIEARLDVERPEMMAAVTRAFNDTRTVIIRGASGQGKSTLAYRWLLENAADRLKLEIREVRDRQHARELSLAISAYVRLTGIPIDILHDVRPGDTTWVELLRELPALPGVRLLITIREDDWRRATVDVPVVSFAEVELRFGEVEARDIYTRLATRGALPKFHDFEAAWARFDSGPLLEFVYLLTQPTSLRERLRQQLERLSEDEVNRPGLLRLLRWAVVADAYGARLEAGRAARTLGLSEPGVVFARLEREYLLRRDGGRLAGIHAVRSQILVELMLARDAGFETWLDTAVAVLPVLVERDREYFLLHAFSRHEPERDLIVAALHELESSSWAGVLGIIRALVWLGVCQFIARNHELIEEVLGEEGTSWWFFLQADLVNFESVTGEPSTHIMETLDSVPEPRRVRATAWRERISEPERVLAGAREWLATAVTPAGPPNEDIDWDAAALVLFWAGHLDVKLQIGTPWGDALGGALERLDTETLVNLNYGAWRAGFDRHFASYLDAVIERLKHEFNIIALEDKHPEIRVSYIVDHERLVSSDDSASKGEDLWHWFNAQSVRLCRFLRGLFPDRERWGAQAVGHHAIFDAVGVEHDPSQMLLPRSALPPIELTRYYSAYHRLVDLRLRVATWPQWCATILEQREAACEGMEMLTRAVVKYFQRRYVQGFDADSFDVSRFMQRSVRVQEGVPPLPRCAVDEWGLTSEASTLMPDNRLSAVQLDLQRYEPARKAISDLLRGSGMYLQQARHAIEIQPLMGIATTDEHRGGVRALAAQSGLNAEFSRLSLHNLFAAWKQLPTSQQQFQETFSHHVDMSMLMELERRERRAYDHALTVWFEFIRFPHRVGRQKVRKFAAKAMREVLRTLRVKIRKALGKHAGIAGVAHVVTVRDDLPDASGLWLVVDHVDLAVEQDALVDCIIETLHGNLPAGNDDHLQTLLVRHVWESLHIVVLTHGCLVGEGYVKIYSGVLMAKGASCTRGPGRISPAVMHALQISCWQHPTLEIAAEYLQHAFVLRLLLLHFNELEHVDADVQATDYMQRLMSRWNRVTLRLLEARQCLCEFVCAGLETAPSSCLIEFANALAGDGDNASESVNDTGDGDGYAWVLRLIEHPRPERVWAASIASSCSS